MPNDAPVNQRYLTGVSAINLGGENNGQPGDVYVGFFNPLHASFGDPAGTTYFMITNALGAYLQDPAVVRVPAVSRMCPSRSAAVRDRSPSLCYSADATVPREGRLAPGIPKH